MPLSIDFRRHAKVALRHAIVWPGIAALFTFTSGLVGSTSPAVAAERWTSLDGSSTVEAEFIGLWGNNVVLELPGPRRVTVSVDNLIADSRIQARRLGEEQSRRRAELRQQILADAKEAAAPAPTPLPAPPTPPPYQRLNSSGGLLAQLEWLDQQNKNGHGLIAAFDSLPLNYQNDLERLLRASVAKLDRQGMRQILGSVHSVGDLVVTRQRWFFSHPRLQAIDADARDTLKSVLLSIGGLIRDGLDPDQLKLDELASTPLRTWLVGLDTRLAPHIAAMNEQMQMLGIEPSSYEVKEEKDGKATVEITNGETKQTVNFITVDGMWLPADSEAEAWAEAMKKWEDALAGTADGSLLAGGPAQMVPMMLDPILQPALAAESAREFHSAMDGWFAMAAPLVAQMQSFGIGNRRGMNPYGGGYNEYGSDYDMEMEMEMDMDMEMEMEMEMDMDEF
ncbi:hypothetical protein NZK35_26105 [Stieleria sp. ICT_E10.1]|uniref:hypothetical protein n=1 Tax=Stieleria sedimenti TaxID=2976331 RepID=UPI00217FB9C1|nr:hypothetical protein [Stieleria sedimenti]MCS7470134.1 hypothetical protein [Stieleria sedimenti]